MQPKSAHVYVEKNTDGTYNIKFEAANYSIEDVSALFEAIEIMSPDDGLVTFPVLAELEDPALMDELNRRIEDITAKGESELLAIDELVGRRKNDGKPN